MTRPVPAERRRETGARQELVFQSRLWLSKESGGGNPGDDHQTSRRIECIVEELADARLGIPVDVRQNEVVPTKLTPVLKLYEKRADDGHKGTQVIDGVIDGVVDSVTLRLGQMVIGGEKR